MFNVYNKIIVDFTDPTLKIPTTKEVFLARLLAEKLINPLKATEKALKALNQDKRANY